jgi:hypothetical protein
MTTPLTSDEYHELMDTPNLTQGQYLRILQYSPMTEEEYRRVYQLLYVDNLWGDEPDMPTFHRMMKFTKKELQNCISSMEKKPKTKKDILGMFLRFYCEDHNIPYRIQNYIRVVHLKLNPYT